MAAISTGVRKQGSSLAGTVNCRSSAEGSGLPLTGHRPGFRACAAVAESATRRARAIVRRVTAFFMMQQDSNGLPGRQGPRGGLEMGLFAIVAYHPREG